MLMQSQRLLNFWFANWWIENKSFCMSRQLWTVSKLRNYSKNCKALLVSLDKCLVIIEELGKIHINGQQTLYMQFISPSKSTRSERMLSKVNLHSVLKNKVFGFVFFFLEQLIDRMQETRSLIMRLQSCVNKKTGATLHKVFFVVVVR